VVEVTALLADIFLILMGIVQLPLNDIQESVSTLIHYFQPDALPDGTTRSEEEIDSSGSRKFRLFFMSIVGINESIFDFRKRRQQ